MPLPRRTGADPPVSDRDPLLDVVWREARAAHLTITQVAAKMQVNANHLGQMLRGNRPMSLPMLRALLDALDLELIVARPVRHLERRDDAATGGA